MEKKDPKVFSLRQKCFLFSLPPERLLILFLLPPPNKPKKAKYTTKKILSLVPLPSVVCVAPKGIMCVCVS